jgi:hypothetical protein
VASRPDARARGVVDISIAETGNGRPARPEAYREPPIIESGGDPCVCVHQTTLAFPSPSSTGVGDPWVVSEVAGFHPDDALKRVVHTPAWFPQRSVATPALSRTSEFGSMATVPGCAGSTARGVLRVPGKVPAGAPPPLPPSWPPPQLAIEAIAMNGNARLRIIVLFPSMIGHELR